MPKVPTTFIGQLTPQATPCAIKVKVLRSWYYMEPSMPITHRHLEMTVLDEKVLFFSLYFKYIFYYVMFLN